MVTLHHGDCLEFMRTLPAGSVDAVVTDPPYLSTDLHFDTAMDYGWLHECLRVVKPNGYLVMFGTVVTLAEAAKVWAMRFSGVWLKPRGAMRTHVAKKPMSRAELYVVFAHPLHKISELTWNHVFIEGTPYRKVMRKNDYIRDGVNQIDRSNPSAWTKEGFVNENGGTRYQTDVIEAASKQCMPHDERTIHPTQKPVLLINTLIQWVTNAGDTVLDCFTGSGTTGVACVQTGRNFIGCEIDAGYFEIAKKRIETAQMQPALDGMTQ